MFCRRPFADIAVTTTQTHNYPPPVPPTLPPANLSTQPPHPWTHTHTHTCTRACTHARTHFEIVAAGLVDAGTLVRQSDDIQRVRQLGIFGL